MRYNMPADCNMPTLNSDIKVPPQLHSAVGLATSVSQGRWLSCAWLLSCGGRLIKMVQ
jgi:hypothetical protein